jgi:hypothetical protein
MFMNIKLRLTMHIPSPPVSIADSQVDSYRVDNAEIESAKKLLHPQLQTFSRGYGDKVIETIPHKRAHVHEHILI